jgi:hypothetical protein
MRKIGEALKEGSLASETDLDEIVLKAVDRVLLMLGKTSRGIVYDVIQRDLSRSARDRGEGRCIAQDFRFIVFFCSCNS